MQEHSKPEKLEYKILPLHMLSVYYIMFLIISL